MLPLTAIALWAVLATPAGAQTYLGNLSANPYGAGSPYSPDSLHSPYGAGTPYRFDSPTNPYGTGWGIVGE